MATFQDYVTQISERGEATPASGQASAPPSTIPVGVQQIIDQVVPMIERTTGKPMNKLVTEAAVALSKGQIEGYVKNLIPGMSKSEIPPLARKDQKWLDYAKFAIFWGPIALLGFGGAILVLIYVSRFVMG